MARATLAAVRAVLVDMDGVLYLADERLPGAARLLGWLEERSFPFLLVTNNSSLSPEAYAAKLRRLGMPAPPERILTSAVATAELVAARHPGARVLVVGEEGLRQALEGAGLRVVEEDPDLVVAGIDRAFTYQRGRAAALAIRRGAAFVGTNPDLTFPTPEGLVPGAGAILAFLEAASGRRPLIVGKPERPLFEQALRRLGTRPEETLMVGDRADTDVEGARRAGLRTALVRTGVARDTPGDGGADWVFQDLPAFLKAWAEAR